VCVEREREREREEKERGKEKVFVSEREQSTQRWQRIQGFLPKLDEFYFTTTENKFLGKL